MLSIKALHIIFVVTWFSGLFYVVRLFIYHTEAQQKEEKNILQAQFKIMEKRLWYFITVPSMYLTVLLGLYLALPYFQELKNYPWLILKLTFVFGLVLYHIQCGIIFRQLQKDVVKYSSLQLRLWNEVATVLLAAIVFIIVLKDVFNWLWGMAGLLLLALCLFVAVKWLRKRKNL